MKRETKKLHLKIEKILALEPRDLKPVAGGVTASYWIDDGCRISKIFQCNG